MHILRSIVNFQSSPYIYILLGLQILQTLAA
jgi:hypothetical protein